MGKLRPATWNEAFARIAEQIKATTPERIGVLMGDLNSVEEMFSLKTLATSLGIGNVDCRQDGSPLGRSRRPRRLYLQSRHRRHRQGRCDPADRHQSAHEASVLNARIRKAWRNRAAPIGVIGERADLTYEYTYLGAGPEYAVRTRRRSRRLSSRS